MAEEIKIKKKSARRGDDGHKVVSVRMRDELIDRLDALAESANRSRNEIINLLLESAVDIVKNRMSGYLAPSLCRRCARISFIFAHRNSL